ncbi:MAG: hypothetical protein PHY05_04780 [Methanothrix sp.]|nr:hypothetical protein [Methanothrix sp.]
MYTFNLPARGHLAGEPSQRPDRGARDPLLNEDAGEMVEYLAQVLRQPSREATILLYAPALDPHLQKITELTNPGVLHLQRAGSGQRQEGRSEDAGSAEDAGGVLVRSPYAV